TRSSRLRISSTASTPSWPNDARPHAYGRPQVTTSRIANPEPRIPLMIGDMPPRYAFWTILIDGKPTAFRARDKEELLPTFNQLRRKNADIVMRWFARGRLWETPEQAQWAAKNLQAAREKRTRDWRPGGAHKDPRAR